MGGKASKALKKTRSKKNLKNDGTDAAAPAGGVAAAAAPAAAAPGGDEASGSVGAHLVSPVAPVLPAIPQSATSDGMASAVTRPLGDAEPVDAAAPGGEKATPGDSAAPVVGTTGAVDSAAPVTVDSAAPIVGTTGPVDSAAPVETAIGATGPVDSAAPVPVDTTVPIVGKTEHVDSTAAAPVHAETHALETGHAAPPTAAPAIETPAAVPVDRHQAEETIATSTGDVKATEHASASVPSVHGAAEAPEATSAVPVHASHSSVHEPEHHDHHAAAGGAAGAAAAVGASIGSLAKASVPTADEHQTTADPADPPQIASFPEDIAVAPAKAASRAPRIIVVIHSTYGHVETLAKSIIKGLEASGAEAKFFRVEETLPAEVLEKMHAAKHLADIPVCKNEDLVAADGFLFGLPTRYGVAPAQIKAFWDATGQLWQSGALIGKYGGLFHSTASQHGGQETTSLTFLSHYAHHGILFVPLGYPPQLHDNSEIVGGSPYGAGTIAGNDGSRQPSPKELEVAEIQGREFAKIVARTL
ncbi:NAD(P)H dehydrogenase (quinone) [Powellomyces hirtus]|uniref:NAD(P)H dehydrogenase (Quinone) n=1 Tax=Powellomyces hirtus TaxID=109895 RepID=A0A507EBI8_9FUNG|nr:NAD(P)H dehydrogenase (quinone) [Powellomyces hirtus]